MLLQKSSTANVCVAITQASLCCVWPLAKGGVLVTVLGKHHAAVPIVLLFIDSAGSHMCPHVFNAVLPLH